MTVDKRNRLSALSVNARGSGDAYATIGSPFMTAAGLRQRGIDTRFDVAFGLAANCGEFRDDQIAGPLKHPLLAERKRFDLAKKTKMLQHFGNLEDVAGSHLVGKILEPI